MRRWTSMIPSTERFARQPVRSCSALQLLHLRRGQWLYEAEELALLPYPRLQLLWQCNRLLVPDNLKTSITKNTRYETVLNRSYQEMAAYYGTAVIPARIRYSQDKSHAEGGIWFASTWILADLRSRKFFSVEEAQDDVAEKLEELNDQNLRKRSGSRSEAYLEEEKEYMLPLPGEPYEPAIWYPDLKVGNDYLVSDGMNKYSAPYDLIGEKSICGYPQHGGGILPWEQSGNPCPQQGIPPGACCKAGAYAPGTPA